MAMRRETNSFFKALAILLFMSGACLTQYAQSPFTYQGVLRDGKDLANGFYEMRFRLYDASTNGVEIGPELYEPFVAVSNGVFEVKPDFGPGTFKGEGRWLELEVGKVGDTNGLSILQPRQALSPAPYAYYAFAAPIPTGSVSNAQLSAESVQTVNLGPGAVTGDKIASNQVVRSLNGLTDNVLLVAGQGLSLENIDNRITIISTVSDTLFDYTTNYVASVAGSNSLGTGTRWQYPDGYQHTIVGWGSALGRVSRIDSLGFWLKPLSNAAISMVNLQLRFNAAQGAVLAHAQIPVSAGSYTNPVYVNWTLPTPVINPNSNVIFFQYIANGRANVMVPSTPAYPYPPNQTAGIYFTEGVTNYFSDLATNSDSSRAIRYRNTWSGTPTNNYCIFAVWSTNTMETAVGRSAAWTNFVTSAISNSLLPTVQTLSNGLAASFAQQGIALSNALANANSNRL